MTRRLIVIRHGKSSRDDPRLDDHDRPLDPRGERAADAIGRWLSARGHVPDAALCSTARRARDTWARVAAGLPAQPRVTAMDRLYRAEADALLGVVRRTEAETVALVGHNPGLADFVHQVVAAPADHPRFNAYPTCATTVIAFDADPSWHGGRVVDFVVPRELT